VRRQRVHQCLIRPALILGMAQKPALLLLAILGAQFTAGGVSPSSFAFLAFDLAVLYPLLVWLAKTDARSVDVFAESLSYRGFYSGRAELRRREASRPLSGVAR
jgi:type IV secretory pathway TrbD component